MVPYQWYGTIYGTVYQWYMYVHMYYVHVYQWYMYVHMYYVHVYHGTRVPPVRTYVLEYHRGSVGSR